MLLVAAHAGGADVPEVAALHQIPQPGEDPLGSLPTTVVPAHRGADEDVEVHVPTIARGGSDLASSGAMDLSFAFFADNASVPVDGKVYVLGGGFSALAMPQLPGRATFAVVAGFRFGSADAGKTQVIELRFLDSDGKFIIPAATLQFQSAGPGQDPARDVSISTVTYLSPMFGEPGVYSAQYWAGERLLTSVELTVEEQQPPAAVAGSRPN